MVCINNKWSSQEIMLELVNCIHKCQTFFFNYTVVFLCCFKCSAYVSNNRISVLKDSSQTSVTGISVECEWLRKVRALEDGI